MSARPPSDSSAAFRALQSAQDEIDALRRGGLPPQETRGLILRVANAVDRSLRRVLRDDESADLSIRLKALAPDELAADAVLAELRRTDRLPMELAAGVHELLEARRRLEDGSLPTETDRARAVRVTDLLNAQLVEIASGRTAPAVSAVRPADEPLEDIHTVSTRRERHGRPVPVWPIALLLLVVVAGAGYWALSRRGPSEIEQGITLFRSGAYAEAAQHFFRYAERNPDDATPHIYLARIHRRMNRPELAAEALREAERIEPNDPAIHRELGFLLLDGGNSEVAVGRFQHAINLEPSSSEGWVGLIRALRESGRGGEVNQALERAPPEVRALLSASGGS